MAPSLLIFREVQGRDLPLWKGPAGGEGGAGAVRTHLHPCFLSSRKLRGSLVPWTEVSVTDTDGKDPSVKSAQDAPLGGVREAGVA